jgi:hypothetical protein
MCPRDPWVWDLLPECVECVLVCIVFVSAEPVDVLSSFAAEKCVILITGA